MLVNSVVGAFVGALVLGLFAFWVSGWNGAVLGALACDLAKSITNRNPAKITNNYSGKNWSMNLK